MGETIPQAHPDSIGGRIQRRYEDWFARLEDVAGHPLNDWQWTGRWYDGFTPEAAWSAGPDEDAEDA